MVDEALLAALESGHVGGAALDVFNQEPLDPDDPHWTAAEVRVSAHCSSSPDESIRRAHELFRENLRRYMRGEPLLNAVEFGR